MIRTTLLFALFFLFQNAFLSAQEATEMEAAMSQGVKKGLVVDLPYADIKEVEKLWKNFGKEYDSKPKKDRKSDEWFMDNAIIPAIGGNNSIDIYATMTELSDNVTLNVWFDLGGAYLNTYEHEAEFMQAKKILEAFALDVSKKMTEIELDNEEKKLKDLEKELDKLQKDKEKYERDIEQAKERIQQAEADIEQNVKDQENATLLIKDQQGVVEEVKQKLLDF